MRLGPTLLWSGIALNKKPVLTRNRLSSRPRQSRRSLGVVAVTGLGLALAVTGLSSVFSATSAAEDGAPANGATRGNSRVLEFRFTPVRNAQLAVWVEDASGKFLSTVRLTEAVALRGIGNRPGASQMNSGFRWPYGRREGVLPIWAHRRASAPGAKSFRRVIFQNRRTEGLASRTSEDYSRDDYFCLSFNNSASKKDALDAVSCASVFNSDKGRFLTDQDVANGYSEPYEDLSSHAGRMEPLTADSLYPPRRDIKSCAGTGSTSCFEHPDVATYNSHVREVMPEIDEVSMATPPGGQPQQLIWQVPSEWAEGRYRACIEANVEGDYNGTYNDSSFPTPTKPDSSWDSWATSFGYPYRGQPSVVYCTPFELTTAGTMTFGTSQAEGTPGSWDTAADSFGALEGMNGMTDDHAKAPGSGADRLLKTDGGERFTIVVKSGGSCEENRAPGAVSEMALKTYPDELEAWQYADLQFRAASDDTGVFDYDVRVSTEPIVDEDTFMKGVTAKAATTAAEALHIPSGTPAGNMIETSLGGLSAQTHYYVGVRAVDGCAMAGPLSVAEITTEPRVFATVSPCFVATAAYGTPLAAEISALRRFRDRHLANNVLGRAFVAVYGVVGPKLASVIREHDGLRAASRALLAPAVAIARLMQD